MSTISILPSPADSTTPNPSRSARKLSANLPRTVIPIDTPPSLLPESGPQNRAELYQVAKVISMELNYQPMQALAHDADWYRQRVGFDALSEERGEELRGMTFEHCRYIASGREVRDVMLWEHGVALPPMETASEHLNAVSLVLIFLFIFVIGTLLAGANAPDDPALNIPTYATSAPAVVDGGK